MRNKRTRAWWLKPSKQLFNVFDQRFIRVWLELTFHEHELKLSEQAEDIGQMPEWLQREIEDLGERDFWEYYLGIGGSAAQRLLWMLERGLQPGQPFLVEADTPDYWVTREGEGDSSLEICLAYDPKPQLRESTAKYFEKHVRELRMERFLKEERLAEAEFLRRSQRDTFGIEIDSFFPHGLDGYPSGTRFTLLQLGNKKDPLQRGWLASGETTDGDTERAFELMVRDALEKLPGLDETFLRSLRKHARNSGW